MLRKDSGLQHKRLVCPFTFVKDISQEGRFTGYGSVFGNVDLGGDIVERGAFKEYALTKDGKLRILYQHDTRQPVGKADTKEDSHGLYVDGELVMGMSQARNCYAGMKAGILDGLSIGYDILDGGSSDTADGKRLLTALKLWEVSVVTFGMNTLAKIDSVKAARGIKTKRQFEDYLRDAGYSRADAKDIASGYENPDEEKQRDAARLAGLKRLREIVGAFEVVPQRDAAATSLKQLAERVSKFSIRS